MVDLPIMMLKYTQTMPFASVPSSMESEIFLDLVFCLFKDFSLFCFLPSNFIFLLLNFKAKSSSHSLGFPMVWNKALGHGCFCLIIASNVGKIQWKATIHLLFHENRFYTLKAESCVLLNFSKFQFCCCTVYCCKRWRKYVCVCVCVSILT